MNNLLYNLPNDLLYKIFEMKHKLEMKNVLTEMVNKSELFQIYKTWASNSEDLDCLEIVRGQNRILPYTYYLREKIILSYTTKEIATDNKYRRFFNSTYIEFHADMFDSDGDLDLNLEFIKDYDIDFDPYNYGGDPPEEDFEEDDSEEED